MTRLSRIKSHLINIRGWRTSRKIVVLESDDWGTVRMASRKAYDGFLKKGYPVDQCEFNRNDSLESNQDLEHLLDVMSSVADSWKKPACITMNTVVGNPNFEAIRQSDYRQYTAEPFTETLKRYPSHDRVMELYREGIGNGCFVPQFHGREHVHIRHWLESLQNGEHDTIDAFDQGMFSVHRASVKNCSEVFLDAWAVHDASDIPVINEAIEMGLNWFYDIWGFTAQTAIAPCYAWDTVAEAALKRGGVSGLQSGRIHKVSQTARHATLLRHHMGQRNSHGQTYTIRNAHFEPASHVNTDAVADCLQQIETAFAWKKPAVISTHRYNYISSIDPNNGIQHLRQLRKLLTEIVKRWPDVEFMSSDALHHTIQYPTRHEHDGTSN